MLLLSFRYPQITFSYPLDTFGNITNTSDIIII